MNNRYEFHKYRIWDGELILIPSDLIIKHSNGIMLARNSARESVRIIERMMKS